MRRPSEPTSLGVFLTYPASATGTVAAYWLATGGTRVRMTGACKRALIATIEAVIERAIAPACAGTSPALNYDFKATALNVAGIDTLISLGKWNAIVDRTGIGARFVRGCPREDWELLVASVVALWYSPSHTNAAGTVRAWQFEDWKWHTSGFVSDIEQEDESIAPLLDVSSYVADNASLLGSDPVYRPWGLFRGGHGGAQIWDWIVAQLEALDVPSTAFGSWTPGPFMPDGLNVSPSPFDTTRGHLGNWFGSSSGGMYGQPSLRRSSSGWAVIQAMLAQMAFTHLEFYYAYTFANTEIIWQIRRWFIFDENWDIKVYEDVNAEYSQTYYTSGSLIAYGWEEYQSGASSVDFTFGCNNVDEPVLAELTRPQDGWLQVGSRVWPFLTPVYLEEDAVLRTLHHIHTTDVSSVTAADGKQYPAPAFEAYCQHHGVTFIDRLRKQTNGGMNTDWTKWSVKQESGSKNLSAPTEQHARWLLQQLPDISFPTVASPDATAVRRYSDAWWAAWELYYPSQPNVTVDGQPAYFPTAIRNLMGGPGSVQITYDHPTWESARIPLLFGTTELAFPDYGHSSFGNESYVIDNNGTAIAAHEWAFKAMPSS